MTNTFRNENLPFRSYFNKKNSVLSITFILDKNAAFTEIKNLTGKIFVFLTQIHIFYLKEFSFF